MSLLKANSVQIGQSSTATNNFTLSVPSSPDGTIKLARGNSGATTADVLSVNASGAITGATISGATINSSTLNGGSITLGTAQNSNSGTAIDFTGIPSWVKRITISFSGVSVNGADNVLVQLGTSSGATSSGYTSTVLVYSSTASPQGGTSSSGLLIFGTNAGNAMSGHIVFTLLASNTWIGTATYTYDNNLVFSGHSIAKVGLSSTLDRVRFTPSGANTFDAGSINIMYEG